MPKSIQTNPVRDGHSPRVGSDNLGSDLTKSVPADSSEGPSARAIRAANRTRRCEELAGAAKPATATKHGSKEVYPRNNYVMS